jgi:hypothetical protein
MIIRLTQKLCDKIDGGPLKAMPLDENPFADWSASLFTADRTQYIIVSNTMSLYSTAFFGKGITDEGQFIKQALSSIREFMEADGHEFVHRKLVAPSSDSVTFAKALNRSVTGSISELTRFAQAILLDGEVSPFDLGFELNDMLISSIASSKAAKYGKPKEAFKTMLGARSSVDAP